LVIFSTIPSSRLPPNRQQNSFGRKGAKQCGGCAAAGHRKFLRVGGLSALGQNNSSPGFARFAG